MGPVRFSFALALALTLAACRLEPQRVLEEVREETRPVPAAGDRERGPGLVLRELPHFHDALVAVVGVDTTQRYLADWSETDVAYFRLKNHALLALLEGNRIPSVERMFASGSSAAYSSMGEVYGIAHFGRLAFAEDGIFFDEIAYDAYNPVGRRPDGLLARIEGPTLVLLAVFESKLGFQTFDKDQAESYLATWKQRGMSLPVQGVTRHFAPERIVLRQNGVDVPIRSVDNPMLEAQTTMVATQEDRGFRGTHRLLPFDGRLARQVVYRWIECMAGGRTVAPRRENFTVPALATPEEVFDYRSALREWLLGAQSWPRSHGTSGVEHFLAREISHRGGQASAFIEDLDDATREQIAGRGILPAPHPFERRLTMSSPAEPGVGSAALVYLRHFEPDVAVVDSALVRVLTTRSPHAAAWTEFFLTLDSPPDCRDELGK